MMLRTLSLPWFLLLVLLGIGCAPPPASTPSPDGSEGEAAEVDDDQGQPPAEEEEDEEPAEYPDLTVDQDGDVIVDSRVAMLAGLMPLAGTEADLFHEEYREFDGRGVVIGILDSGVDLGLPGLQTTTTGSQKVLDARDFSGEGRILLDRIDPGAGSVDIGGMRLTGFETVAGVASAPFYGGVLEELPLGEPDVDGNGRLDGRFPILVGKTSSGWAVFADTDSDGSLADENAVHDFLVARETFTFSHREGQHHRGPMTLAANFVDGEDGPVLDLFFDNSGHGSHVAGIAAGHNMFDQEGFDGVAPGAQLIAVKISNNARGGVTVDGSMVRAMNYAADFAQQRGLPLVLNLSFGVGNEIEGTAAVDSIVAEFSLKHPDVVFTISAGNEGPGLSTVGFPGSADHILSVCALYPGVFSGPRPPGFATDADEIAEFSSRGGELAKPDLCAPGIAYSNVPPWNVGNEISPGTSMAAPHVAGLAALLQSAMVQAGNPARGVEIRQALVSTAEVQRSSTALDGGVGIPKVRAALDWLKAGHQAGVYTVRTVGPDGQATTSSAAFHRNGLSPSDTTQGFLIQAIAGQPSARLMLRSDAGWLGTPEFVELQGGPSEVTVSYDRRRLRTPGLYVGSVWATPANDSLAGAAFRLTNTVIVPHPLDQPFVEGRDLGPGRLRRYFFAAEAGTGGFTVELELRYRTQSGTVYLFEPDGAPFRGGGSEVAGGSSGRSKVRITVGADEVVPGVYEVVAVAPANSALSYELRAARPRYLVEHVGPAAEATVAMRADPPEFVEDASVFQREGKAPGWADSVRVGGNVIGVTQHRTLQAEGIAAMELVVPGWAGELTVDVELPEGLWAEMTDMAMTMFDTVGAVVEIAPLTYARGRQRFDIPPHLRGEPVVVEFFPAFAHVGRTPSWEADLDITFLARRPVPLTPVSVDTTQTWVLQPGESAAVRFSDLPPDWEVPDGFEPVLEVVTEPAGGAPSRRRNRIER